MRTIDESGPETLDNLESDEMFECPGCGDLLIHTEENPDAICPTCKQEGPPAQAQDILERWRAYPFLLEENERMSKALKKIAANALEEDSGDEDDKSNESLADCIRSGTDAEDSLTDAVRLAHEALKPGEPPLLAGRIAGDPLTLANFRAEFEKQDARIKALEECLRDNLVAWCGEEESVKEEHQTMIQEIRQVLGDQDGDEDGDGEKDED